MALALISDERQSRPFSSDAPAVFGLLARSLLYLLLIADIRGWFYEIARGHLAKYFRKRNKRGIHESLDKVPVNALGVPRVIPAAPAYQEPEAFIVAQERLDEV